MTSVGGHTYMASTLCMALYTLNYLHNKLTRTQMNIGYLLPPWSEVRSSRLYLL